MRFVFVRVIDVKFYIIRIHLRIDGARYQGWKIIHTKNRNKGPVILSCWALRLDKIVSVEDWKITDFIVFPDKRDNLTATSQHCASVNSLAEMYLDKVENHSEDDCTDYREEKIRVVRRLERK
ncbi:hypothetical protein AB6A40_009738 [Gnathostoma spinigerum]|uniref:Uncharacterized protein n=1 Tax=Gnathostoma spinigerum TaxID=75299 RepID=A0ABD6F051_9BILA